MILTASARAKINLHLHITGRRNDGFHLLDSLVAFTNLCDHLRVTTEPSYHLRIDGQPAFKTTLLNDCPMDDNLITRATRLLSDHFTIPPHVGIDLTKSIPLGAGLGGGSADAAATLKMLCTFWNLKASDNLLVSLASQMGSDIVACLNDAPVIMRDTGSIIFPAPKFPMLYGLLVNPNTPCPTPAVYKYVRETQKTFSKDSIFPAQFVTGHDLCTFLNTHTHNDLTDAAIAVNPDVRYVLNALEKMPDCQLARLSGSGSTCFGIFENEDISNKARDSLQKDHPEWWVKTVRINESV
jgi:4-diphosphocytidyl-2-C-methyl-D-erythritol kinase